MTCIYFIFALFFTQVEDSPRDLKPFHWLSGTWIMPRPKGGYNLETWKVQHDQELTGMGFRVNGTDTLLTENLKIVEDVDGIWYIPTVPDQNQGQPVKFKLIRSDAHQYVFENPAHDFPQRITYQFKPISRHPAIISSAGDTLEADVTTLAGDGLHFRFFRK